MAKLMDDARLAQYRGQQRKRRVLLWAFFPVGFALMVAAHWLLPDAGFILVWPMLLIYTTVIVVALNQLDTCPWCKKSFYQLANGGRTVGFSALLRRGCANCGMPNNGGRDSRA